jgi:hypothetical protein
MFAAVHLRSSSCSRSTHLFEQPIGLGITANPGPVQHRSKAGVDGCGCCLLPCGYPCSLRASFIKVFRVMRGFSECQEIQYCGLIGLIRSVAVPSNSPAPAALAALTSLACATAWLLLQGLGCGRWDLWIGGCICSERRSHFPVPTWADAQELHTSGQGER